MDVGLVLMEDVSGDRPTVVVLVAEVGQVGRDPVQGQLAVGRDGRIREHEQIGVYDEPPALLWRGDRCGEVVEQHRRDGRGPPRRSG